MYDDLSLEDRLRLVRFACSIAWADLEVGVRERDWVADLIDQLELPEEDREVAEAWLDHPPIEEDLDPFEIPAQHRELFLDTIGRLVGADGRVDPMEIEVYALLASLLDNHGEE